MPMTPAERVAFRDKMMKAQAAKRGKPAPTEAEAEEKEVEESPRPPAPPMPRTVLTGQPLELWNASVRDRVKSKTRLTDDTVEPAPGRRFQH